MAFVLLVFGLACCYGWQWVPASVAADVQNVLSALMALGLLVLVAMVFASREVIYVAALLGALKATVITCNTWFAIAPWPVLPGDALCSTKFNLPLGVIGLALGAALAAHLINRRGK